MLFGGSKYRLEIGIAIHQAGEHGLVNTSGLAEQLGLNRQSVNQELRLLEQLGLLRRLPNEDSERKVYFTAEASPYWKFCAETAENAAQMLTRGRPF